MDIVFIEKLNVEAVVGIYAWERQVRQSILIDLEMAYDNTLPARSNDIADALDYAAVIQRVTDFVTEQKFELVETMAEEVAAMVMREFKVPWLKIRCAKPTVMSQASAVGVVIERGSC